MSASPYAAPENCPDENVLAGFASGTLSGPAASSVEAHLDGCADCRALVAAVAAERSTPDAETLPDKNPPTRLDRGTPGMALEPSDRFPSMDALLEALTRPPTLRRRWVALGLAGSLALAGIGAGFFRAVGPASTQLGEGTRISLTVGEQRELQVENMTRIAVGSTEIVDVKIQGSDTLRFTGVAPGTTVLLLWQKDGDRQAYTITVGPR
jgi:anti-sigma factor RsiW